ncbi:hypothetical protein EOD23_14680 [Mesorhizobium sp. USDA-HM6]|nr:hypothetical protein EOD23_14680 [Mesorhizobium sp. USDA-HM6]
MAYLNLMEGNGGGVVVDGSGWKLMPLSVMPVAMADRSKALPLPEPVRANDGVSLLDRLTRHIPLEPVRKSDDPDDIGTQQRASVLMFLGAQVYRPGPVPHLMFAGAQGSSKTTTARRIKSLTDPDEVDVVTSLPADEAALYAIAAQQGVLVVDNLSLIQRDISDVLAALATGAGHQKRELYSDGGRAVFRAKSSLILTTIREDLLQQADLAQRTLVVHLPPLDPKQRRTEKELDRAWGADRPRILADLLDAVSGGLARLDAVEAAVTAGLLPPLPRLADAALLAEAMAQGLGWKPGLCINAVNAAQASEAERQLEENPYAFRVRALLEANKGAWCGTRAELYTALQFEKGPDWGRARDNIQAFTAFADRASGPMRSVWGLHTETLRSHGKRSLKLSMMHP